MSNAHRDMAPAFWERNYLLTAARLGILLLAGVLVGCAPRPGPEVLNPIAASVPGSKVVTIYVVTTRAREVPDRNIFTSRRSPTLNYAEFKIMIPPGHRPGNIEWPSAAPDPATSFTTVAQTVLDRQSFEQRVASHQSRQRRPGTRVFVHGYNRNFQESLYQLAQMAADADSDGAQILFSWPSEAKLTGYVADKDAVAYSRDQLAGLLTSVARNPANGRIKLIGHSMGGWLTVEALRQLRLTGQNATVTRLDVILAAPDIDVDVFRAQMAIIGPLSPPMTLLVSRDDVALSAASRISTQRPRLGALDVNDPRVQEAALRAKIQIVDISSLQASDRLNHDRYISLAALYPQMAASADNGQDLRRTGAFILNTVGATLSSPFSLVGTALAGE